MKSNSVSLTLLFATLALSPLANSQQTAPELTKASKDAEEQAKRLETKISEINAQLVEIAKHDAKKEVSPLLLTILGAIATGIFAVLNSRSQAQQALHLEEVKLRSTLILKAIDADDPEDRRKALAFYVDTGLLSDPGGRIKTIEAKNIPQAPESSARIVKRIGTADVKMIDGAIVYRSGLGIDSSGGYRAYHPDNRSGLDYLANAGTPGNWWGLITDNGTPSSNPVIQSDSDPAPGFYVSPTSLEDPSKDATDPRRYVDSSTVPFIDLPGKLIHKSAQPKLGDLAAVYSEQTGKLVFAVYANIGPAQKLGEGSIALAERLGIPSDPKRGGVASGILTIVFPNSGGRWPMTEEQISRKAEKHFDEWGGLDRLKSEMSSDPRAV